tara:strand:+ start:971 stop:1888 length:918 start_codon:yes stop_codon:yes gene_type:complete
MLTSFFGTSKPINFIVITIAVIAFYMLAWPFTTSVYVILEEFGILIVYIFTLGVLNFVVKRNTLTKKNTYILFFYACFTLAMPICFKQPTVIFSGLFVLLALRRIISLRSQLEVKKKIFDAAFWIAIASLFYFWSLLFLIVLYIGILFYGRSSYKNWLIPIVGIFVVAVFALVYAMYTGGVIDFLLNYIELPVFDFRPYSNIKILLPISFFLALYIWCVIKYMSLVRAVSQNLKPSYSIILASSIVALIMAVLLAPVRDGSEVYFLFGPLAIITSRYIEKSSGRWFNEMLLWISLALPVIIHLLP